MAPYAKADAEGQPMFSLPGRRGEPLPLLAMRPGAYMARMVDVILKQAGGGRRWTRSTRPTWPRA
jgi:hypothetical protein